MKVQISIVALILAIASQSAAAVDCGELILSDTRLTNDLVGCPGAAFEVRDEANIVVDLAGFRVASAASAEASIVVHNSHNIRIVGGSVGGPRTGIAISGSNNVQLEDLLISDTDTGIYFWAANDSQVSFSEFTANRVPIAIHADDLASRVTILSNRFEDNSSGVLISRSHDNVVEGNVFRRNVGAVLIASSKGNSVIHNGIFDGTHGVYISNREPAGTGSNVNVIEGNKLYDNVAGIVVRAPKTDGSWSKYNVITRNAFRGGSTGVDLVGPRAYRTEIVDNAFYDIGGNPIVDGGYRSIVRDNRCSPGSC